MKYFILFLLILSCGSRDDGTVTIKSVQGIGPNNLAGGIVVIGTDGIERFTRTFVNADQFVSSVFAVPGDREWEFKVFSWQGDGSGNQRMKGKIRCGFVRGFVNGGENLDVPVDLTNSSCIENLLPADGGTGNLPYDTDGNSVHKFKPIRLFGCSEADFDIIGGQAFTSSDCYTGPSFGVSRSYRVIIEGKGQGGPGVGIDGLFSACYDQDTTTGGSNLGAILTDLNLPTGYFIHPQNYFIPLDFPVTLQAFSDPGCTPGTEVKLVRLQNSFAGIGMQFNEPGYTPFPAVIETHTNYVNYAFHDELPSIGVGNFLQVFDPPFLIHSDIAGGCSPEGAIVELYDVGLTSTVDNTACSGGSFLIPHGVGEGAYNFEFRLYKDGFPGTITESLPFPFVHDTTAPQSTGISSVSCSGGILGLSVDGISAMNQLINHGNGLTSPDDYFRIRVELNSDSSLVYEADVAYVGSSPQIISDVDGIKIAGSGFGSIPTDGSSYDIVVIPRDISGNEDPSPQVQTVPCNP